MKIQKGHIALILILMSYSFELFSQEKYLVRKSRDKPVITSSAPGYSPQEDKYDVGFYFVDLVVTNQNAFISGASTMHARRVSDDMDTLVIELSQKLMVDSVLLQENRRNDFIHENNLVKIPLNQNERVLNDFRLKIFYEGNAGSGGFFAGISNQTAIPWNQKVTYTLSEPFQGMDWFPVKQNLKDKADSAWVFITVDPSLKAGSNGLLTAVRSLENGKNRFEWKSNYPIAYYLLSFSVGDYVEYTFYANLNEKDSVLVQNYIYDSPGIDTVKYVIDQTTALLKLFSEDFGTYPFINEKYGHCMAPMGGGMEHQTMTTLSGFNIGLVAHELAHSWFGDYLTCGTWQDIWINEGFASYAEYIALEALDSKEAAIKWLVQAQNVAINYPFGSVFLTPEESRSVQRIFSSALSYKKGGSIIHMLRYEIKNDSLFFAIIRDYIVGFGNSTATGEDFQLVVEKHTGKDFQWFFDQWYYGKGFPVFVTSWRQVGDTLLLNSTQTASGGEPEFFRTHMDYRIFFKDGETKDFSVLYEKPEEVFRYIAKEEVSYVQIDPDSNVLKNAIVYKYADMRKIFTASPNPFRNTLNIVFGNNTKKHDVSITAIDGKVIYSQSHTSGSVSLDLPYLRPGIYLLQITEDGNKYTEKILRQ
jgi:aminopeptidase N